MSEVGTTTNNVASSALRELFVDLGLAALQAPSAFGVSREQHEQVRHGAQLFVDRVTSAPPADFTPSQVPSSVGFTSATTDLGKRVLAHSPELPWIPARQDPHGNDRALLSINSLFDLGPLVAGFVLVRANSYYPVHQHPPQELYLTIEGHADWRFGGHDTWAEVQPGSVFYNPPDVLHGQRNGTSTNLSLYVLWP